MHVIKMAKFQNKIYQMAVFPVPLSWSLTLNDCIFLSMHGICPSTSLLLSLKLQALLLTFLPSLAPVSNRNKVCLWSINDPSMAFFEKCGLDIWSWPWPWKQRECVISRNKHVEYESSMCYYSKVMSMIKAFCKQSNRQTGRAKTIYPNL